MDVNLDTGYPDLGAFRSFPHSLQANVGTVPIVRPRLFHSASFPAHLLSDHLMLYSPAADNILKLRTFRFKIPFLSS